MPITTYTLTADLNKIAGSDDYRIVSAHLTTNQPADVPIVDKSGKTIRLPGPRKLVVDVDGTITETVIASDSPDINITDGTLRYQVTVEYQTTVRQHVVKPRTWTSPWFSVTAATDLADKLEDEYLPPTVASAAIEQVNAAVAEAEQIVADFQASQTAIDDLPSADPLDGSEYVPVWQDGENRKVTTDDLAGLDTVVRVPASLMFSANGSPSLSAINRHQAWLLDANSNEAVGFNAAAVLPEHWSTFHIDVVWINAGAGAGDITLRADYSIEGDGAAIANPTSGSVIIGTHTAGAQNVRVRSTITNTVNAPTTPTDSMPMALFRMATNVSDTLPNDCGILEVLLVRET